MRDRLRSAREEKGLTQEQLAHLIGYRSKSQYCMIESGQRGVSVELALSIGQILGKPVTELFGAAEVHDSQVLSEPIQQSQSLVEQSPRQCAGNE